MTGLEAIWIPMVAGAVTGGGVAAAKGGSFGDIAKGAGIGAAGGAVTGGAAAGLGALGGAAGGSGANTATNAITAPPTDGAIAPNLASQQVSVQNLPEMQPTLMDTLNAQSPGAIAPAPERIVGQNIPEQVSQQTPKSPSWTTADYINATSSAANLAAKIAQTPPSPPAQIAPMPAIFSGQGGDLMQQLAQLSQG